MERAHFRRQAETSDAQLVPTRPTGVLLRVPRSVGNPTVDTACKTVHSTTLFPKPGVLRGETPKCVFGDFLHKQKVTPRSVGTPLSGKAAEISIRPCQTSARPDRAQNPPRASGRKKRRALRPFFPIYFFSSPVALAVR